MAGWLIPALKAVLPHVGDIISVASPVFTKKKADTVNQTALLQQQVSELQAAASQNAANIKELASELQSSIAALERRTRMYCVAALVLAIIALGAVLLLVAR